MNVIRIKDTIFRPGEYLVGAEATGSHTCYLIYGVLDAAESRSVSPGSGHEEIMCLLEGVLDVRKEDEHEDLQKGECLHLVGEETVDLTNTGEGPAIYVLAGGHSPGGHDH